MDDLKQQIKAWADASAPPAEEPIDAADIIEGRYASPVVSLTEARTRRRGWLLTAAAAVVVGVAAVGVAVWPDNGPDRIRAGNPDPTTTVPDGTATTLALPVVDVTFDLLGEGGNTSEPIGSLRSAQNADELAQLWSSSMRGLPLPEVDFTEQVVVSMTIGSDACPPTLSGFERTGRTVEPRFLEPQGSCEEPLVPMTYVAALDWNTTGDDFLLLLLFDNEGDGQQETLQVTR
jgi:hypothetical protein